MKELTVTHKFFQERHTTHHPNWPPGTEKEGGRGEKRKGEVHICVCARSGVCYKSLQLSCKIKFIHFFLF